MTKAERARELFLEGCNCAQAVFLAFAEEKMDRDTALKTQWKISYRKYATITR